MNKLFVKDVVINTNKVEIEYEISGDWGRLFAPDTKFWVEYSSDISNVPKSIAIIPFLGSVLSVSWVYDSEIIIDEIDKAFYDCLPNVLKGYKKMYPNVTFGGKLTVNKVVENSVPADKSVCLFSGGVDAFNTLLSHYSEKPELITIWGADVECDNVEGWKEVDEHIQQTSEQFNLSHHIIRSNLRKIYNKSLTESELRKNCGDGLWHGFQHGMGMLTLLAPLAYVHGISRVYIASSYTASLWGKYTCASDPVIDNEVKYINCSVHHDGYEYTRQDKIRNICKFSEENNINIPLRVCWESKDGKNCCICEKCCRTLLGLYAEKVNPENFGFALKEKTFSTIIKQLKSHRLELAHYYCIQKILRQNYKLKDVDKSIRWFYKLDLNKQGDYYIPNKPSDYTFKERIFLALPPIIKKLYRKLKK